MVGGGVIGLCCAWYCRQAGFDVVVVERNSPAHAGCSFGNAGLVSPSHIVPLAAPGMVRLGLQMMLRPEAPFSMRMAVDGDLGRWALRFCRSATRRHVRASAPVLKDLLLASKKAFENLAAFPNADFLHASHGLILACRTEEALEEERRTAALTRELGMGAEILTPEEMQRLDPAAPREIAGGVYHPEDAHLEPAFFMRFLVRELAAAGVAIRWDSPCLQFRLDGNRIVSLATPDEVIAADAYVIATGAWTPALMRPLGFRLLLQPGKGYSITHPSPPSLPTIPVILKEARVAITPMGQKLRFAGTMELGQMDHTLDTAKVRGLLRSVESHYPDVPQDQLKSLPAWSGLRPCSADGLPYIGRLPTPNNAVVATGHSMLGLSLGPITGILVSQILAGHTPQIPLTPLTPDRFTPHPKIHRSKSQ